MFEPTKKQKEQFKKWWAQQTEDNPDLAPGSYWGEILKEFVWSGWRACLENEKKKQFNEGK